MKKSLLAIIACLAFYVTCLSQTKDSVISESRTNGVWQKSGLDIFTRDASCSLVSVLSLLWDESSHAWVTSSLSKYSYNNSGGVSEVLSQSWDATNNVWVNSSQSVFFTSNEGTKKNYISQYWDAASNTWVNSYKITENVDEHGRTISSEFDLYSGIEWQKIQRSLLSYDADNHISKSIFQVWGGAAWVNNGKTTYDYSGKGISFDYLWDNGNSVWTIFRRTYNDYLENTALSEKSLGQIASGGNWENAFRSDASYNDENNLRSNSEQFWDAGTQSWINGFRLNLDYYADASQHHYQYENWDASTNSWGYGYRATSTDVLCPQNLQIVPVSTIDSRLALLPQNSGGKMLLHRMPETKAPSNNSIQRVFNPLAGDGKNLVYDVTLTNGGKQYAFELVLSADSKSKSISSAKTENAVTREQRNFVISPNPAKNYFNINLSSLKNAGDIKLKLSDISGKTIMQQKVIAGMQRVNLPSLQKGLYIVTLISGKEIRTQKLVVE